MLESPATTSSTAASALPAAADRRQALYRRFRAQTFAQMVGQDALVQTLRNAIRLGRLGHAFLFVGPRGTGKTSMARILAKAVNCTDLQDGEPCDRCASCAAIREGRALDVIELDAASNNKVDDMRELVPRVYTAPADLRRKVFIIDEVQRIKEGWDVLLKTLEEPPEGVVFIFCTTDPSQIRPAVVSRLQRFTFRPLAVDQIEGKLRHILASEGRAVEPEAIALIARLAGGGMRDAESMLDQVLASAADPVTTASIGDLLGLADEEAVDGFVAALVAGDALAGIAVLDRLESEGRDLVAFSDQVVGSLRSALVARLSGSTEAERSEARALAAAARRLSGIDAARGGLGGYRWQLELSLLAAAEGQAPAPSARPRASLPTPASALPSAPTPAPTPAPALPPAQASAPPPTSHEDAPSRADAPSSRAVARTRATVTPPSAAAGEGATVTPPSAASGEGAADLDPVLAVVTAQWDRVVAVIGANPANRPLIAACRPVEVRGGVLVLGFPENQSFLRDRAEAKRRVLEDGISQVVGRPVAVRCVATNLARVEPVPADEQDLVARALHVFRDELVGVEDIE